MQLSIGLSLTFVVAVFFALRPKRLHPFELVFAGFVSVFLYLLYFLVVSLNWGIYEVARKPDLFLVYLLFRFIVTPILVLSCLELVHQTRLLSIRLVIILAFAGILTALTSICCAAGVLIYRKWSSGVIFGNWLVHLVLVGLGTVVFRSVLRKEVRLP